jgi:hypothetical protein
MDEQGGPKSLDPVLQELRLAQDVQKTLSRTPLRPSSCGLSKKWRPRNGIIRRGHRHRPVESPKLPSDLSGVHHVHHLSCSISRKCGARGNAGPSRSLGDNHRCQWTTVSSCNRCPYDAARRPARPYRSYRQQEGMRPRPMRRLYRDGQRPSRAVMSDVGCHA